MINASSRFIRLTPTQSILKYGNPYGSDANMFMLALNTAWKAKRLVKTVLPSTTVPEIDGQIKECVAYLKEHEQARPWGFNEAVGYFYKDLSAHNWEGRWRNMY